MTWWADYSRLHVIICVAIITREYIIVQRQRNCTRSQGESQDSQPSSRTPSGFVRGLFGCETKHEKSEPNQNSHLWVGQPNNPKTFCEKSNRFHTRVGRKQIEKIDDVLGMLVSFSCGGNQTRFDQKSEYLTPWSWHMTFPTYFLANKHSLSIWFCMKKCKIP